MAHSMSGPDEKLLKKRKKLEVEQQLRRAQNQAMFWRLVKDQNPPRIIEITKQISELEERRTKLQTQLDMADREHERYKALSSKLSEKAGVQKPVEKTIHQYLKLLEKVKRYEEKGLLEGFTPEQLELLRKAQGVSRHD